MSAPPREFVTVVSGVPRSGTSLLMQLLDAGGIPALSDGLRAPDASNPRGYYEHALIKGLGRDPRAADLVRGARGRALKVIHALLAALPADVPLRVVVADRALADVVASQADMLGRKAPPSLPPSDSRRSTRRSSTRRSRGSRPGPAARCCASTWRSSCARLAPGARACRRSSAVAWTRPPWRARFRPSCTGARAVIVAAWTSPHANCWARSRSRSSTARRAPRAARRYA